MPREGVPLTRKAGTDKVMSNVLIQMSKQSISWDGGESFSGASINPNSANKEFIRWKERSDESVDSAP